MACGPMSPWYRGLVYEFGGDGFEATVACVGDGHMDGTDDLSERAEGLAVVQLVETVDCVGVDNRSEWRGGAWVIRSCVCCNS